MKNEYSKKEIERILRQDVEIPENIEARIQDTYEQLGIGKKVTMKYTKKRRTWVAVAAVAVMAAGMSVVTLAANKFLSANLVEKEDTVNYSFHVDRETEGIQRLKSAFFRPIAAGEEIEYTLVYVADEDQLDHLYLWFFGGTSGVNPDGSIIASPYVKIG